MRNNLVFPQLGMSSRTLLIVALHLDYMMPPRLAVIILDHPDILATVEDGWNMNVEGTPQFSICRKLKVLKSFNSLHYNNISARAKEGDLASQEAQIQLETHPGDVALRNTLGDLRKKADFLAEAERHFFYQKAKSISLRWGTGTPSSSMTW
ncbi:hypothetical protein Salat_0501900 [Sesamum alatum]|uniref:Uncharacterized protein n=1 Tax=Sesamum alatum TaxID=300844 RepID=A0AAE1Z3T8_9LAMI|nr:hypothetical protein Salat_0501900 [Sesamum alatum]